MALFVTHSAAVGGAEIVLGRYLAASERSHHVLVLSSGDCPAYFRATGACVTALDVLDANLSTSRDLGRVAAMRGALTSAAGMHRVLSAIRRAGERVVITNSMKAHVMVPAVARVARRPVGIRLHDVMTARSTSATARRLLRGGARLAVSTACVSEAAADAARAIGVPRVTSFPNGVGIAERLPETDPGPPLRLLVVSQLARWKGVHDVLAALAQVRDRGLDAELDILGAPIFGDAAYADELRRAARDLGVEQVVRWHGHTDPAPFLESSHLLVHLPVEPDPLPTVLLESLADGLPVVATRTGGIPEIVRDGVDGLLVDPGRADLAAAAIGRLAEPCERIAFREAALRDARERFSVERYVERFDAWIDSVERKQAVAA
jgi:glycosyltransferase involved in cell wall biosynthesis